MPPSILVLADFFDRHEPGRALLYLVGGSLRTAQPNRSLAASVALQRLIVVAGNFAYFFEAIVFDGRDPDQQVVHDVPWKLAELLLREPGDLDAEDHQTRTVHPQGELVKAKFYRFMCPLRARPGAGTRPRTRE